jgi:hypothetical protein
LALLRLVVSGDGGLFVSGVFFLVGLKVFYFVVLIVTVPVMLAFPGGITDSSPRNDIIYGYWVLTKTIYSEKDGELSERTGLEPLFTTSAKSVPP